MTKFSKVLVFPISAILAVFLLSTTGCTQKGQTVRLNEVVHISKRVGDQRGIALDSNAEIFDANDHVEFFLRQDGHPDGSRWQGSASKTFDVTSFSTGVILPKHVKDFDTGDALLVMIITDPQTSELLTTFEIPLVIDP